jgi:hypothetical protein
MPLQSAKAGDFTKFVASMIGVDLIKNPFDWIVHEIKIHFVVLFLTKLALDQLQHNHQQQFKVLSSFLSSFDKLGSLKL